MTTDDEIQWIIPIAVGAIIPFILMWVSKIGSSQKSLQANVMNIENLKADILDIRNQTKETAKQAKETIGQFTDKVTQIMKSIEELKEKLTLNTYRLDQMEKRKEDNNQ